MKYTKYYLLSIGIIILDQVIKLLVHYNMFPGFEIPIFGDWFKLHYTENPGMAFGMTIAGKYGKLVLSFFRLVAMTGIAYVLYALAKKHMHSGLLWSIALVLGGAIGNVIDGVFYGVLLDNAPADAPTPWFHGQVVDMFFIDICNCWIPDWVPLFGGQYFPLWPIFNIADAAIFIGFATILIMQKKFFKDSRQETLLVEEGVELK